VVYRRLDSSLRPVSLEDVFKGNFKTYLFKPRKEGAVGKGQFSSDFEGGNLAMAVETQERTYDLLLQNDTNSRGYNQWFYFLIEHPVPKQPYRFRVLNLRKKTKLYSHGWSPIYFSVKEKKWRRATSVRFREATMIGEGQYYRLWF
jgi:hypothetical protein